VDQGQRVRRARPQLLAPPINSLVCVPPPGTRQVLDLLSESVDCAKYSQWVLHPPGKAPFPIVADREEYIAAISRAAGPQVGGGCGNRAS
jgi:hypothetical protein